MLRVTLLRLTSIRRFSASASTAHSGDGKATSTKSPTHPSQSHQAPDPEEHNLLLVRKRMHCLTKGAFLAARNRADNLTASAMNGVSQLGFQLNRITGYEDIEALKERVVQNERKLEVARQAARDAKARYATAVAQRSNSQREVNDLLQRKSNWNDNDIGRFTTLVRLDHSLEQEEAKAKTVMDDTDNAVEKEFSELMRSILARYHEEQVWSDKIRSASTYGSLAALGLNLIVFVLAIVVVEPWKRKRLTIAFEQKVREMSVENKEALDETAMALERKLEVHRSLLENMISRGPSSEQENNPLAEPSQGIEASRHTRSQGWAAAITVSAALAGVAGWLARGWLGTSMP